MPLLEEPLPDGSVLARLRKSGIPVELRYLVVVVIGYVVDLASSIAAFKVLGLGLAPAAILGFCLAVVVNYLALEFWTFPQARRTGYLGRLIKYYAVALFTLLTRTGFIFIFEPLASSDYGRIAVLVGAAGFSLILNYILTRFAVFGKS